MSLPAYPAYKETGAPWLGRVPSHWEIRRVGDIVQIINGFPFDSDAFSATTGHPLVRIRDLNASETAVNYVGDWVDAAAVSSHDLLIGMDGDFNVGRWLGQGDALLNQRMCCLRGDDYLINFLSHALPDPLRRINEATHSTTVKHLSSGQIRQIRVAVPKDDEELRNLAVFLDRETSRIDDLITEQERLLSLLAEKRQATISRAVTKGLDPSVPMKDSGVEWLGQVPAHWKRCKIKHVLHRTDYGISESLSLEGKIPVLRMSNLRHGSVTFNDLKFTEEVNDALLLRKHDLLFNRTNSLELVGQVGIVENDPELPTTFASYLVRLRVTDRADALFLNYVLGHADLLRFARRQAFVAIGQANLNATRYVNFTLYLPDADEQRRVAASLLEGMGRLDTLTAESRRSISLLRERRAALISAAVTGKIDVRGTALASQDEMEAA